jgi:hypothetical protein
MSYLSPQVSISQFFKETLEAIPAVAALGPNAVWATQAPADVSGIIVVYQQIGPGRGVSPIGGRPVAANYRFQWRVGYRGEGYAPLIPIAQAIQERLMNALEEVLPGGQSASFLVDVTDLPPQPVDDSGRPMQELGGEVTIFVDFGVSP